MEKQKSITVLMSTYNGQKYLREQIDSILCQEGVSLKLVIRDDGSEDNTVSIIKDYQSCYDNIELLDVGINMGACQSFLSLIATDYETDYYALADQDDIWDKDKLICAIKLMEKDSNIPLLYYSNLRIVDSNNHYCRLSLNEPCVVKHKYAYLAESLPTGCTVVYNSKLAELLFNKIPDNCFMHDAWLYIAASAFGKCIYDHEPHINYRQHEQNVVGASKKRYSKKILKREWNNIFIDKSEPRYKTIKNFYTLYADLMDNDTKEKFRNFIEYKDSVGKLLKVLLDKELNSENIYRRTRFKIKLILHRV